MITRTGATWDGRGLRALHGDQVEIGSLEQPLTHLIHSARPPMKTIR